MSTANLLDPRINITVKSGLSTFYAGPRNIFGYTILQGLFTVLAIKEVMSIVRHFVKGHGSNIRVDRAITWSIVENWEYLYKVMKQDWSPGRMHRFPSEHHPVKVRFNDKAWRRSMISGMIGFFIFACYIALNIASVPTRIEPQAQKIERLTWTNRGRIPNITKENILIGSFSKSVALDTLANDIEFTRQPSVSLERTDFRDFNTDLPTFENANNTFFQGDATEGWRIVCKTYCENWYYQYKLRLDVLTKDEVSEFFPSTANFSVVRNASNPLHKYKDAMKTQLDINVTSSNTREPEPGQFGEYFALKADELPPEYTYRGRHGFKSSDCPSTDTCDKCLDPSDCLLTHDAVASIFLNTVLIETVHDSSVDLYFERGQNNRETRPNDMRGIVAISQRPYLPLYGTAIIYVLLQLFSIYLQTTISSTFDKP